MTPSGDSRLSQQSAASGVRLQSGPQCQRPSGVGPLLQGKHDGRPRRRLTSKRLRNSTRSRLAQGDLLRNPVDEVSWRITTGSGLQPASPDGQLFAARSVRAFRHDAIHPCRAPPPAGSGCRPRVPRGRQPGQESLHLCPHAAPAASACHRRTIAPQPAVITAPLPPHLCRRNSYAPSLVR